ncbi:MAG: helicase associated domain-containing protein [Bacteroidales bacterium]|nr:helicase associated domain-containing protein [Bacteroidales bacterium]MBR1850700.1 helicase associated domain-containing protein [Bacteroidales bacterium]
MTQEELWERKYNEVMEYMTTHHRNPSKHRVEEHPMVNWMKHQRKMLNQGKLKPERKDKLMALLNQANLLKRKNQWGSEEEAPEQHDLDGLLNGCV